MYSATAWALRASSGAERSISQARAAGRNSSAVTVKVFPVAVSYSVKESSWGAGVAAGRRPSKKPGTAEAVGWARLGYRKILCVQPFACLPGHIFGKGQYAAPQRKLPGARLVSVDYDASTGEGTVLSRIRMLLDEELDPELL